jgi:membrane-bound lytic murein transglycosylase
LKGRWTVEWVHQFDRIHADHGEQLATKLILAIWHAILKMWKCRCDQQHDSATATSHDRMQLEQTTRALYSQKAQLDAQDQQALDQPIQSTLRLSLKTLKDWVKRTEAFVKQGIRRSRARSKTQNHPITRFFQPASRQRKPPTPALRPNRQNISLHREIPPTDRIYNENTHPP